MNDELVKDGCGRCAAELEWNAKVWFFCVLACLAFILAAMLTGCAEKRAEVVTEKQAERALKNLLNGL